MVLHNHLTIKQSAKYLNFPSQAITDRHH